MVCGGGGRTGLPDNRDKHLKKPGSPHSIVGSSGAILSDISKQTRGHIHLPKSVQFLKENVPALFNVKKGGV